MRNIVFDVGDVLVQLRYGPFIEYLAAAGADCAIPGLGGMARARASRERRAAPGERSLSRLRRSSPRPLDPRRARAAWLDMFAP